MKYHLFFLSAVLVLSGCSTTKVTSIQDPVGPKVAKAVSHSDGSIVVYTPTYVVFGEDYPLHSNYEIYTKDGVFLKKVKNNQGNKDPDPVEVSLAVGEYKVKAESKKDGILMVPVIVAPSKTTVLDLNNETQNQFANESSAQLVKSASGGVIGCKAPTSTN